MGAVIELDAVRKSYRSRRRRTVAVDSLSMSVGAGGVHGFLGPNGSGKTTTIRILLGLVAADSGTARVLGADASKDLASVSGSVGALVETPQLFAAFSGRRNLEILARMADVERTRVDEMLELVGLTERADDRVKGYSLGMRQRLAIAAAMLKRPLLLILDEPTNGLDPAGMVEVRELIRRLGADGHTTVFLSSHLLAEVAAVCDAVTILRQGSLVASGPVAEILNRTHTGDQIMIRVGDPLAAVSALQMAGVSSRAAPDDPGAVVADSRDGARLNQILAGSGLWASEISLIRPDLEAAFIALTTKESSE